MSFNKLEQRDNFRWKRIRGAELDGKYDMPKLAPVHDVEPTKLIGFNQAKSIKNPEEWWFHFYLDDYHFERIWNKPSRYLNMLRRFQGGITTDYSIYLDMPRSQQIWNCWRNRSMAFWMQQNGICVIPNVGWSDAESLEWAFDGLPEHSVLSITTQGCMNKDYVCKQSLVNGIHELARRKEPEKLIVYGKFPDEWKNRFPMPIVTYKTFSEERWGA